MKGLRRFRVPVSLICLLLAQAGCGVAREEHEEVRARLEKVNMELVTAKTELESTRKTLERAGTRIMELERSLGEERNRLETLMKSRVREKKTVQAPLIGARQEMAFLRQKVEELMQGLKQTSGELDLTRSANEALQDQVSDLTGERDRLRALLSDREAEFKDLERRLETLRGKAE